AALVQVAAVDPQLFLVGRLPHVAQLAFPRPRVFGGVGAQAPDLAHAVGHFGRHQIGQPVVHGAETGGVNDEVGRQLGAVGERHALGVDALDIHTAFELDAAVGHQLAGAHIDVIARATAQVLHEQARA